MRPALAISRVNVALPGGREYPILLGDGLLGEPGLLAPYVGTQALIVTNAQVADLYLAKLRSCLNAGADGAQVDTIQIGDGERHKTLATFATIIDELVAKRHNRTTTVVALGRGRSGGRRRIRRCHLSARRRLAADTNDALGPWWTPRWAARPPSITPPVKNLVGAFHQPRAVVADVDVLGTLPRREFRAGLAEVIKYGVIADAGLFSWLEEHLDDLLALDAAALLHVVRRSCEIKARVVAADEREQGHRAILNFGHTFGHAIEALTGYRRYLHGEAVAIGMVMAMRLSAQLGRASEQEAQRVRALIDRVGLPTAAPRSRRGRDA